MLPATWEDPQHRALASTPRAGSDGGRTKKKSRKRASVQGMQKAPEKKLSKLEDDGPRRSTIIWEGINKSSKFVFSRPFHM